MSERSDKPDYGNLFHRLEQETNWDLSGVEDTSDALLLSIDDDCLRLSSIFAAHCARHTIGVLEGKEQFAALMQVAKLMENEFHQLQNLRESDILQTRGEGLCMTIDERGGLDEILFITDETRLRGELLGVTCLPVPTDYALLTNNADDPSGYAPTLCLVLEAANLHKYDDIQTHNNIIEIPLRMDGFGIDKVIMKTGDDIL